MGYRSTFNGQIALDTSDYRGTLDDLREVVIDNGAGRWADAVSTSLEHPRAVSSTFAFVTDENGPVFDENTVYVNFICLSDSTFHDLDEELVTIARALQALDGVHVSGFSGARDGSEDGDYEEFSWANGTVHSSQTGTLTDEPIDPDATVDDLVAGDCVPDFLQSCGVPEAALALLDLGKRLGDPRDPKVFTQKDLTALAAPLRPVAAPGDDATPDALTHHAAERVLDRIPDAPRSGDALVDLGFELGESITYEDGMTALVTAALRAAEDSKQFVVMCAVGGGDPEGIMGRYRTRREADAVAEAWNRCNGEVAAYTVVDEGEYDENGNEIGGSPAA